MDHVCRVERNRWVYVVHVSKFGCVNRDCLGNTKKVAICAYTSSKKRVAVMRGLNPSTVKLLQAYNFRLVRDVRFESRAIDFMLGSSETSSSLREAGKG